VPPAPLLEVLLKIEDEQGHADTEQQHAELREGVAQIFLALLLMPIFVLMLSASRRFKTRAVRKRATPTTIKPPISR
jgi:hypothetical protein